MEITLVMFRADGVRRDFPLTKSRVVIGRQNTCELRVPLSNVSRKHCEIRVERGAAKVRDLGSSNGTLHNGTRIKSEVSLHPGDRIQVGSVIFTVVIDGVPAELDASETLLAAQANAERALGGGVMAEATVKPKPPKSKPDKAEQPPEKKKEQEQPEPEKPAAQAEEKSEGSAADELDALLSDIGDNLLDRSGVDGSGADVELLPDDDDEEDEPPKSQEPPSTGGEASDADQMMAGIEDRLHVDDKDAPDADSDEVTGELLPDDVVETDDEALPELDESDAVESLPERDESDAAPSKPAESSRKESKSDASRQAASDKQSSETSEKKRKKKSSPPPGDDDDPISALEAMASDEDDDDIDLSWLEDDDD